MKLQPIALVILCGLVSACTTGNYPSAPQAPKKPRQFVSLTQSERQMVERAIRQRLKDPNSAMFNSIGGFGKSGVITVCGMVNARNSFGGYTGDQLFSTLLIRGDPKYNRPTQVSDDFTSIGDSVAYNTCNPS